jgi:hypothetical protein
VDVPCRTGGNNTDRLPIRCRGGFFEDEFVEIEYGKVFQQLQRWMAGIHRCNAIFLLSTGTFFEESTRETFARSARRTWLRGVWIF